MDTMQNNKTSIFDKSKLFIKTAVIFVMALFLTIPSLFINGLVTERKSRQEEAITDITSKWGKEQMVQGPLLVVPYRQTAVDDAGKNVIIKGKAYFLPASVKTTATIVPEKRYRGIYQVVVYRSQLKMEGRFDPLNFQSLKIPAEGLLWDQAALVYKVSDPERGINEDVSIKWDDSSLVFSPQEEGFSNLKDAFVTPLPLDVNSIGQAHNFSMDLSLNGSQQLLFATAARENIINMKSSWQAPSFTGVKLPDSREISDSGFTASWKFLNRSIPMVWRDASFDPATTAIGAELKIPVDGYDKTQRTTKYAILCIILTFAAFFLIETMYKRPLHLVHYGLAGLALVLFYTLLLSVSEYSSFNIAYLVAGIATIGLVTWFIGSILKSGKLSLFISFVLGVVYTYIFCIIQLEDYSLLMGSIGLFISLAIIMYFSRKLSWN